MFHDPNVSPASAARIAELNARYTDCAPHVILEHVLTNDAVGPVAVVSSFGAEAIVLLHMVSIIDCAVPILFIDTEMLFDETVAYQRQVADYLGLRDVRVIRAERARVNAHDADGRLHKTDPNACCALRKTEPLQNTLTPFAAWVTGRKRFQGAARAALEIFDADDAGRIKVNPLAHWSAHQVQQYMTTHRLPRHPLAAKGYVSVGCAPCTTPVGAGESPRAGRWRGTAKDKCGIHIVNGRIVPKTTAHVTLNDSKV